ncbi:MAG TPA: tetratricopeptide repeat protein [Thermoanaerobaculia bacterium]|nr:tetratricopeptide repeat protein [Thermoanaerobaculia bacterium]
MRIWELLLSGWLLAGALAAAEPPAIPAPDLSGLEPAVARQIEARQEAVKDLAHRDPDPRELAAAWGELGMTYHAYQLAAPAETCYRRAAEVDPKDVRWPHLLGGVLQDTGRLDEAAAAYDKALEIAPGDTAALVHRAEIHRLQGRGTEAEAALIKVLAAEPRNAAVQALLGQAALERGDFKQAAELLEAALAAVPAANRLYYPLSRAYRGLGQADKEAASLAKVGAVGIRPPDPILDTVESLRTGERAHLENGKRAFNAGRHADAAAEFRQALEARPESVEARINLAAALAVQGDRAGAVTHLREALQREPANATARFNLATLLAADGANPEAIEHLTAAVAARPDDLEARGFLARLLRDAGRSEDALREYARVLERNPTDEDARLGEAETLVRLERYREARTKLEDGLKTLPQSGLLAHGLARLLAACPDVTVRDGARALELGLAVWNAQPAAAHAETLALAWAELGRCDEAARWQHAAIGEAGHASQDPARFQAALARYEKGAPCRP